MTAVCTYIGSTFSWTFTNCPTTWNIVIPVPYPVYRNYSTRRRAVRALLRHLTVRQKRDYRNEGFFWVAAESGRRYRINCENLYGNVWQYDVLGRKIRELCAFPGGVPLHDALLAQKMQLELDEESFLRVANVHVGRELGRTG